MSDSTSGARDPQAPSRRPAVGEHVDRDTLRWTGVGAAALFAGGLGALLGRASLVLVAVVGVAFAAHARAGRGSPPALDVTLERSVSRDRAPPGETVGVTLTVRNEGGFLPDLRVVDGVPPGLDVVSGSPRAATALRSGAETTLAYEVRAVRGRHAFDPVVVLGRGASGSTERETRRRADGAEAVTCVPRLPDGDPLPLRPQTAQYTGRVATDSGGPGTEFHAVREYRHGDPLSRIHWARAARTGELSTVEFRQERAATVVVLVDTREEAYLAPDDDAPSAVERSVAAAGAAVTSLLSTGDQVGISAYGPASCWLAPGTGDAHRAEARRLLAVDPAFAPTPADEPFFASIQFSALRRRLPADAQLVVLSPLCDDYVASVARRLDAYGHLVTVVTPDPTTDATPGGRLARVERSLRLSELRRAGVRVVDWAADEPLAAAVARADGRWGQ